MMTLRVCSYLPMFPHDVLSVCLVFSTFVYSPPAPQTVRRRLDGAIFRTWRRYRHIRVFCYYQIAALICLYVRQCTCILNVASFLSDS